MFFGKLSSVNPLFQGLSFSNKLLTSLCPPNTVTAKLTNKLLSIMTAARSRLEKKGPLDLRNLDDNENDDSDADESLTS